MQLTTMKKQIFAVLAAGTLLLPLGIKTVRANSFNNQALGGESLELAQNSPENNFKKNGRKKGRRGGMKRILSKLDLSAEQTQQIEAIQTKYQSDREPLHQELRAEMNTMRSLFSSDATTQEIQGQRQTVRNLKNQLEDIRFNQMLEVREVLTTEQRDQMAELLAERMKHRLPETTSSTR